MHPWSGHISQEAAIGSCLVLSQIDDVVGDLGNLAFPKSLGIGWVPISELGSCKRVGLGNWLLPKHEDSNINLLIGFWG